MSCIFVFRAWRTKSWTKWFLLSLFAEYKIRNFNLLFLKILKQFWRQNAIKIFYDIWPLKFKFNVYQIFRQIRAFISLCNGLIPLFFSFFCYCILHKKSGQIIAVISLKKGLLILLQSAKMTLTKSEFLLWKKKEPKKQGKQRLCAHFLWKRKIITVPCRWSISLLTAAALLKNEVN